MEILGKFEENIDNNYVIYTWQVKSHDSKVIEDFIQKYEKVFELIEENAGKYFVSKCFEIEEDIELETLHEKRNQFLNSLNLDNIELIEELYDFECYGQANKYEDDSYDYDDDEDDSYDYDDDEEDEDEFEDYFVAKETMDGELYQGECHTFAANNIEAEEKYYHVKSEYYNAEPFGGWENEEYHNVLLKCVERYQEKQVNPKKKVLMPK